MTYIPKNMQWISFFGPRKPVNGQKIYYYGEGIGVWKGRYKIDFNDPVSPHLILCEEENGLPNEVQSAVEILAKEPNVTGVVDNMDAPWWMPYEGQPKPPKPDKDYPDDYPS
jgi:hypothetical protein